MGEVMRAPFCPRGSLAIWTMISWPSRSRSLLDGAGGFGTGDLTSIGAVIGPGFLFPDGRRKTHLLGIGALLWITIGAAAAAHAAGDAVRVPSALLAERGGEAGGDAGGLGT